MTDRLMTKNWKKKLDLIYLFVFIITFFSEEEDRPKSTSKL